MKPAVSLVRAVRLAGGAVAVETAIRQASSYRRPRRRFQNRRRIDGGSTAESTADRRRKSFARERLGPSVCVPQGSGSVYLVYFRMAGAFGHRYPSIATLRPRTDWRLIHIGRLSNTRQKIHADMPLETVLSNCQPEFLFDRTDCPFFKARYCPR